MLHTVWSQWEDLKVPSGFTRLSPSNCSLETDDLSKITFYVPTYAGHRPALLHSLKMPHLQILQMLNAGYDDALEFVRPGMTLCNARGVHNPATAELALGLAIASRRGFVETSAAQASGEWQHHRYSTLSGSRAAIVGYGSIAHTLETYLAPLDVEVVSFSRSGKLGSHPVADFDAHLPSFDVIFLLMPLNSESLHFFNAQRFSAMKDGALLLNIARGAVVDTSALVEALATGRIHAAIDVVDPEPLPAGHPLWKSPHLMITPHIGGQADLSESRGKEMVENQLIRLSVGQPLENVIT